VIPGTRVRIDTSANGLVLTGQVANPAEAERVVAIAHGYLTKDQTLDNRLSILSAVQVNLRVRVAEVDRQVTQQLGINWTVLGTIGKFGVAASIIDPLSSAAQAPNTLGASFINTGTNINTVLDLLAQDNLATILAEPNLVAMSGETASFLAGGEYPIPIASANQTVTIAFKQYGVSLAFVPTVLASDRISLRVRPEVSQLSNANAVTVSGGIGTDSNVTIPALTVRRAETTVELGSGQSFAIAGMLQSQLTNQTSGLPWLGDLPVIGALFRSNKFQRDETELVIVVTPVIVRPVDIASQIHMPTDGLVPANDMGRILFNRQLAPAPATTPGAARRIPGDAGFILN
jgi:pilus assembly protein CpaC